MELKGIKKILSLRQLFKFAKVLVKHKSEVIASNSFMKKLLRITNDKCVNSCKLAYLAILKNS